MVPMLIGHLSFRIHLQPSASLSWRHSPTFLQR
jgi:hypothetical protein